MATIVICDRCGDGLKVNRTMPGLGQPYTTMEIYRGLHTATRDLCETCRESFDAWLSQAQPKGGE